MKEVLRARNSERGGAGIKFLLIFVVIILLANAGYNYIPVAYQGETFKQDMDTAVVQGNVLPMNRMGPLDAVRYKLGQAAKTNNIPDDAVMEVKQSGNGIIGRVSYVRDISILPFGLYDYTYAFDYTATPSGYVNKES